MKTEAPALKPEQLQQLLSQQGSDAVFNKLSTHFVATKKYHELFEILKMKARNDLGLPILYSETGDELDETEQQKLESCLLDVCKRVGQLFMEDGAIREGWMYLQPVGDRKLAKQLLEAIPITDQNMDEIVDVAIGEQVSPEFGYKIVLEQFGTCNAITTFDTQIAGFSPLLKSAVADLLVEHFYHELVQNVAAHIEKQEGKKASSERLSELLNNREWLTSGGSHHIDTTHLASVVRIARNSDNKSTHEKAIELSNYGTLLDETFHYKGEHPLDDHFADHLIYFKSLVVPVGADCSDVTTAISFFQDKADTSDKDVHGTIAAEVYIQLLFRLGRYKLALAATEDYLNGESTLGIAPSVFEIVEAGGLYEDALNRFASCNDLLKYTVVLLKQPR